MNRKTALIFLFLSAFAGLSAQYYETGQDPASLKWKQIKTEHFRVIFPESYLEPGKKYAKALENAATGLGQLYPEKKFRIPVVIHNYTTRSNGYVAWAPSRMELYPTPDQNNIPLDPFDQLSIHEAVHVKQLTSLNTGFTKGASWLLGQQITGGIAVFLPLWLLEGEAVFAESALTESGRGRIPAFEKELKAISVEKGRLYGYDKMINGSFRNYVPDHYQLGYQIAAWGRAKYSDTIWNEAFRKTGAEPFTLNPVNISLRNFNNMTKKKLFIEAFDTLGSEWRNDIAKFSRKEYAEINPPKKERYINYYSPVSAGTDSIIAVKTSLTSSPSFVLVRPSLRSEKRIHTPGLIYPYYISCGGNKLVWVELQYDMRWENREYSVIRIKDLSTGTVRRLTVRSRYMAASISPDGKTIAAVNSSVDYRHSLVFIDPTTGEEIRSIASPENSHLQRPQWSTDGKSITFISLTTQGEGIIRYSVPGDSWETLVENARNDLQSSVLSNDTLYFISSAAGTDNVMMSVTPGEISSITNTRFGASDLSHDGSRIWFSDYSVNGNNISTIEPDVIAGIPLAGLQTFQLINRFDYKSQSNDTSSSASAFEAAPYRKWSHLFRFHSWMPFYADLDEIQSDPGSVRPGLTLMTQNTLSTLISTIGYEYSEEKEHLFHTSVSWRGWYPVLETSIDYGMKPYINKTGNNVTDPAEVKRGLSLLNTLSVPLRFTNGRFFQYLRPSYTLEYSNDYIYIKEDQVYDYGQAITTARVYFSNYQRYAWRDINPRWAQSIDLGYTRAPWDKDIYGTSHFIRGAFYFPGFFPNHSIRLRYETEKQEPVKFMYGNKVSLPRGYSDIRSRERELVTADYVLPLLYPDINLASFIYLTRIRGSVFYDYTKAFGNTYYSVNSSGSPQQVYHGYEEYFSSYGFELLADFYPLRLPFMVSGGIQTAWTRISNDPVVKFIFTIDLFGMNIGKESRRPD